MATTSVANVRIAGIVSAIPEMVLDASELEQKFGAEDTRKIIDNIGVRERHVVEGNMCASDLCLSAAEVLLQQLGWSRESIDVVVFVSQTPDHVLPATACSLHGNLNLAKHCAAFDINLGCSGYVYGLWVVSQLMSTGQSRRALLLSGDTISKLISDEDRSAYPLFGDAGSATAVEYKPGSEEMVFVVGTDGKGAEHLIVPAGGFRHPKNEGTAKRYKQADGNTRSDEQLRMDGAEIFTFTLREVPPLVKATLQTKGWSIDDVDAFVFHQANAYILNYLARRIKIPADKFILAMESYGNTSCASIPLALTSSPQTAIGNGSRKLLLAGFGVGLSWAAAALVLEVTDNLPLSLLVVKEREKTKGEGVLDV